MRALAVAAVLGIALSLLPPSGRSTEACSLAYVLSGWDAVENAYRYSDLVVAGRVEAVEGSVGDRALPERVTLKVSSVLRGTIVGPVMTFENLTAGCRSIATTFEPGEHVVVFLYRDPHWYLPFDDNKWYVDEFAPKLMVSGDSVYLERLYFDPAITLLGFKDRVFQRIGTDLGADQPTIDAAIAGERVETGWGLAGVFGAAAAILLVGSVLVRRRIAQASEAEHDSAS